MVVSLSKDDGGDGGFFMTGLYTVAVVVLVVWCGSSEVMKCLTALLCLWCDSDVGSLVTWQWFSGDGSVHTVERVCGMVQCGECGIVRIMESVCGMVQCDGSGVVCILERVCGMVQCSGRGVMVR